jgi:hypothetical protein
MKREDFGCLLAGIVVSCLLVSYFAPPASAYYVFVPNPSGGLPLESSPNGSRPFCKWNFQRFTDGKIPYWINKKGSDDLDPIEVRNGLEQSFDAWKEIDGVALDFRLAGYTNSIGFNSDGVNVISWDETGNILASVGFRPEQRVLAFTYLTVDLNTAEILDVDIVFNGSKVAKGPQSCTDLKRGTIIKWNLSEQGCRLSFKRDEYFADFQATATHEIGHLLGLAHSDVIGATMSTFAITPSFINSTEQSTLEDDDRAGIRFLYGDISNPCSTLNFTLPIGFAVGGGPVFVAVADFNKDTKPDLAALTQFSSDVYILLGDGTGGFSTTSLSGFGPGEMVVDDFNRDGNQDMAAGFNGSNKVSVYLGNGTGGFGPVNQFGLMAGATGATSISKGDFNKDGRTDLAVPHYNTNSVSILLGDGTGGFNSAMGFAVGSSPSYIAVSDFNMDGKPDLAISNHGSNSVSIWLGDGTGGFATPSRSLPVGFQPSFIATGDFNKDGKTDLAVDGANVTLLSGNGTGDFDPITTIGGFNSPRKIAVADYNVDGNLDLALVTDLFNVVVMLGDGAGGFGSGNVFAAGNGLTFLAAGDFNKDGKPDLAAANWGNTNQGIANSIEVLLNACQ